MPCAASTGRGWRWTGRWARRRSAGGKTGPNPTDRGKRGVKRSVLTDGRGVPLGAAIDGANRNDRKLMRPTLEAVPVRRPEPTRRRPQQDRKSTRLNSSHANISYAVFCLKKK